MWLEYSLRSVLLEEPVAQIIFSVFRQKQTAIRYGLRLYFDLLRTLEKSGIILVRLYTTIECDDLLSQELSRGWSVFPFLMLDLKLFRDSSLVNRRGSWYGWTKIVGRISIEICRTVELVSRLIYEEYRLYIHDV